MSFAFTKVERGKIGFDTNFPDNTVRLTRKTLSFNESVSRKFNATRYKTVSGDERLKINLGFDLVNQAIQIHAAGEGFTATLAESGYACLVLPTKMKTSGLPSGDYQLVDGEHNVFQLAR